MSAADDIKFNADVSDDVALAEGDKAADKIASGATVIDHLKVGRALMVGSRIAAKEAGCGRGKPYNIAFSKWLEQHPKLKAVNEQKRAAALWCLDPANWPRVEKHLATLDIEERQTVSLRTVRRRLDVRPPRPATPKTAADAEEIKGSARLWSKDIPGTDPGYWPLRVMEYADACSEAGLDCPRDRFIIVDREYAAEWYEDALAACGEAQPDHPDAGEPVATEPPPSPRSVMEAISASGLFRRQSGELAILEGDKAVEWFKDALADFDGGRLLDFMDTPPKGIARCIVESMSAGRLKTLQAAIADEISKRQSAKTTAR